MTIKELLASTARPALAARTTGSFMLRGPNVAFAPEDDDAGSGGEGTEASGAGDDEIEGGEGEDDLGGEGGEDTQAGDDTEAGGGDDTLQGGSGEDTLEAEPKRRIPWQTKRIDKLTAEKAALAEEARIAKEEAAALRALQAGDGTATTAVTDEEINRRAKAIAAANAINEKVNTIYDAQLAKDPKLAQRILVVREAVGDQLAARPDFFEAIIKVENGGEVFNALTKDIDQLAEILEMPPVDMGIEIARLAAKAAPSARAISPSGARRPPRPIESAAAADLPLDDPNLSQAEYSRRRAAEREARRGGAI